MITPKYSWWKTHVFLLLWLSHVQHLLFLRSHIAYYWSLVNTDSTWGRLVRDSCAEINPGSWCILRVTQFWRIWPQPLFPDYLFWFSGKNGKQFLIDEFIVVLSLLGFLSRPEYILPVHYLTTAEETEFLAILLAFSMALIIGTWFFFFLRVNNFYLAISFKQYLDYLQD